MSMDYFVDADIAVASTLESAFYHDEAAWALVRERVFARTWHWIGDLADVAAPNSLAPRELLRGLLDEPLLLARDRAGTLRCLSNVCTHRGNILVSEAGRAERDPLRYHSRRFDLAGRMTFMPEFEEARNFPSPADDLPHLPFGTWAGHGVRGARPRGAACRFSRRPDGALEWLPVERFGTSRRAIATTSSMRTGRCTWRTTSRASTSRSCTRD